MSFVSGVLRLLGLSGRGDDGVPATTLPKVINLTFFDISYMPPDGTVIVFPKQDLPTCATRELALTSMHNVNGINVASLTKQSRVFTTLEHFGANVIIVPVEWAELVPPSQTGPVLVANTGPLGAVRGEDGQLLGCNSFFRPPKLPTLSEGSEDELVLGEIKFDAIENWTPHVVRQQDADNEILSFPSVDVLRAPTWSVPMQEHETISVDMDGKVVELRVLPTSVPEPIPEFTSDASAVIVSRIAGMCISPSWPGTVLCPMVEHAISKDGHGIYAVPGFHVISPQLRADYAKRVQAYKDAATATATATD